MRITENELVQNTFFANHDGFLDILAFTSFFANHDFEKNGDFSDSILPELIFVAERSNNQVSWDQWFLRRWEDFCQVSFSVQKGPIPNNL